jgi:PAS domain S-box-containing protein
MQRPELVESTRHAGNAGGGASRRDLGTLMRQIAEGISAATGASLLTSLVEKLAGALDVDYAFIGALTAAGHQVRTTAVFNRGKWLDNFTYDLAGKPCEQIVTQKASCFPANVARQFPHDPWLSNEGMESYVGVALQDSEGQCLGLLGLLDRRPMANAEDVLTCLRVFAPRAAAELERQCLHEALRQSQERGRHFIDAVPGGIAIIAPDDTILQTNPGAARILGLSCAEILKHKASEFCSCSIHEDGSPCSADDYPIGKCYRTGEAQPPQIIGMRRPDGTYSWVVRTIVPLRTPGSDHVASVLVTFFDITEHKQSQERLRKSEEFHRLISEIASDYAYSCRVDPDGQIRMESSTDGFRRVTGYTVEEAEKQGGWATLIHPDDLPAAAARLAGLLKGESHDYELRLRTKSGATRWIRYTIHPLWNERENRIDRLIGAVQDITERKQGEEKLCKSEEFHRLISEVASDYAYSCRVDDNGILHMESVTDGFTRVTGYTLAEMQAPGDWTRLIHPEELLSPQNQQRWQELIQGKPDTHEMRIVTKSGDVRWVRYSTRPILDPITRRVTHLYGAINDITERKLAEERHQDLSRRLMEVQEEERRHLARELHDQVGQLLTGIKIALERGKQPGPGQRYISEAQNTLRELTALVRDLSLGLRPSMLDDLGLLPALLWLVERCGKQTGLKVRLSHRDLEGRFPAAVETAAFRIIQEALTNAARHGGAAKAVVQLWRAKDRLMVQVSDDGCGFDPHKKPSGLSGGLSGMQERAALLGGRFLLETQPAAGTCITAELPVSHPSPPAHTSMDASVATRIAAASSPSAAS